MNNLNDNNRCSFIRIQTLVGDIITSGRKRGFLARVYVTNDDDGKTTDFNTFWEGGTWNSIC